MSGHHPFHALAAKLTVTSAGRAAVDQYRRQMDAAVSLRLSPAAEDRSGAETPPRPLPPQPAEDDRRL
jgi:hypothetical protein